MKNSAFKYALLSQASLLSGLLICLAIRPKEALKNFPVSYFGNFRDTIIPYAVGFLLCIFWLIQAARSLPNDMRMTRLLLLGVAVSALGVLCTPYMVGPTVGFIHLSFAIVLLMIEVTFSVILISRSHRIYAILAFLVQLFGAILSVVSQLGVLHVELIGELSVIVGFGIMISIYLYGVGTHPSALSE